MSIRTEIEKAIKLGKDIEIEYVKYDGTRSKRRVSDISFCNEYGAYGYENDHISGYCHLREEKRHFKIDRIQSIRVLPDGELVKKNSNADISTTSNKSSNSTNSYNYRLITYSPTTISSYSLKSSSKSSEGCYIATMVYGDYDHPKVMILRQYRDNHLMKSCFGRWFVKSYYYVSPKAVKVLRNKNLINNLLRKVIDRIVEKIRTK
ncbi:MAG: WYL domain-containing protein [Bacteroidales bacterium]|nr:WYL domain-containing protein [Bacteroidales bacterium]MBR4625802.1 WYL domain-containing protein [Alphaproteobacteria bacterium]